MSDKRSLIEVWFQRVWAEEDKTAIDDMMHDMGETKGLGEKKIVGPTEFKEFHSSICALLSDIRITIQNYMEDGNWSSVYCRLEAKSKLGEGKIDIDGMVLVKIEGGKIVEAYNQFDFMNMWGQLGLLPADAFAQCLQGNKIV